MADYDFSGVWRSTYWYTSQRRGPGEFESSHTMMVQRRGNQLVFQSLPNDENSFLLIRLRLDGRIASGGWEESTSPMGHFKGERFYGPIQLILDEGGKAFRGMWLGIGRSLKVKAGRWEIEHVPQSPAHPQVA
jgi:hypothetical protein